MIVRPRPTGRLASCLECGELVAVISDSRNASRFNVVEADIPFIERVVGGRALFTQGPMQPPGVSDFHKCPFERTHA